jgi:hypothetical protein
VTFSNFNAQFASPFGLAVFAACFPLLWCASSFWVSWVSGWHSLARRFKYQAEPYGDINSTGRFASAYMRYWSHYGGMVLLTPASDALYISIMFLFRFGHPPLRIPWSEIQFDRTRFFFFPYIVLTLGSEEQIPLRISQRMARNLGILGRFPAQS